MKYIDKILQSKKTVFTYDDITVLLSIDNHDTIKSFFARWVEQGVFVSIAQGIYGLRDYNRFELAAKLKKSSYISFETVLKASGIIFQDYSHIIFSASDNTITKQNNSTTFTYLKLKDSILTNPLWLINTGHYIIATPERAICDRLYLSADYFFDHLEWLNYTLLEAISQIYNKRVILSIQQLIINAQSR